MKRMDKLIPTYTLNDGQEIPVIGLGTVGINGAKGVAEVMDALDNGYRLIDTSTNYNNEGMVGEAVRKSSVPRDQILLSSKLPGAKHQYEDAIQMIQESLYRMGLDYFDKYLIHWPLPKQDQYVEAWQALVDAQKFGLIRSIGVSNFLPEHLDRIIEATGVTPASNQVERHPYFTNKRVIEYNKEHGILTEAWSPFGREINDLLENETLASLAEKHQKSVAQIILRWNYQENVLVIPKASSNKHQRANLDIFDFTLSEEEMKSIDSLDKGLDGLVEGQHPNEYEEFD